MKKFLTGLKFVGRTILSANHPLVAQLVVTRRCNLSCAYCNQYDKVSPPVPLDAMKKRIEALANLKTAMITCTGGEPLLHPELETIINTTFSVMTKIKCIWTLHSLPSDCQIRWRSGLDLAIQTERNPDRAK